MTVSQANLARNLIAANGRLVTFLKLSVTPTDASQPWRGSASPRETPAASIADVAAVFVPPSVGLGFKSFREELIKKVEQIALVSTGGTEQTDLSDFDEIIDTDGQRWKIEFVEKLMPASVSILYFVGVRR